MRGVWLVVLALGCGAPAPGGEDAGGDGGTPDPFAPLAGGPYDGAGVPWILSEAMFSVPALDFPEWPETFTEYRGNRDGSDRVHELGVSTDDDRHTVYRLAGTNNSVCSFSRNRFGDTTKGFYVSAGCGKSLILRLDADGKLMGLVSGGDLNKLTHEIRPARNGTLAIQAVGYDFPDAEYWINARGDAEVIQEISRYDGLLGLLTDRRFSPPEVRADGTVVEHELIVRDTKGRVVSYGHQGIADPEPTIVVTFTYRD